jgi:hypothetical protein
MSINRSPPPYLLKGLLRKRKPLANDRTAVLPGKKATITFKIDKAFFDIIKKDAERNRMSINSTVNTILQKYALCYRYTEKERSTIAPLKFVQVMLNQIEEQKLLEHYRFVVHDLIPSKFVQSKIPLTLQNWIRHFCNGMMVHSGAIVSFSTYLDADGHLCLVYTHNHGIKWSKVLGIVLSEFIEDVLSHHTSYSVLPSSFEIRILERDVDDIS